MASIGRFAVAAASATQDTTLALASINFDFSLVKMEAPLEYRGLGTALSTKRRREAEEGSTHITARKLGALFADDLPHIPNLSRAYGLRVSEIAENPEHNPRGSADDGPFAEHVGADGTSIWAAATSGRGAMAVHLLACLLARSWAGPKAVSIWSEIIAGRKQILQSRLEEQQFHIGMVTACQVDIDRSRLAEWDASARSWLRTADTAMRLQQTQLMLIIDNMNLPIPSNPTVYDDVMKVWTTALSMVENLINGMAQSVQSGEALLGLCAWHIYPDICAIGDRTTFVAQKDNLVKKGGLVTIGLQNTRNKNGVGVAWSMPLAHLRYYGKSVMSHAIVESKSFRVPFDRIVQIALGSLMGMWSSQNADPDRLAKFLVAFNSSFENSEDDRWPALLSREGQMYIGGSEAERAEMARYIALGRRRYPVFLAETMHHPSPCFGLCDPSVYIQLLAPERRLSAARDMAKSLDTAALDGAIIRCVHDSHSMDPPIIEIASLIPETCPGLPSQIHRRWLVWPYNDGSTSDHAISRTIKLSIDIMKSSGEPCGFIDPLTFASEDLRYLGTYSIGYPGAFSWSAKDHPRSLEYLVGCSTAYDDVLSPIRRSTGWQMGHLEHAHAHSNYNYAFGITSNVAVYRCTSANHPRGPDLWLPIEYVTRGLSAGQLEAEALSLELPKLNRTSQSDSETFPYFESLIALAGARELYTSLPQAEADLNVVARSLYHAKWARVFTRRRLSQHGMLRTAALACVSFFETGHLDLDPECFEDVLAISSANNIYASELLFRDPLGPLPVHPLRHVIGNVGKPGLALLLLPKEPDLREPDLETWELVNHTIFDGRFEDNFKSTSLHLSLTGYEQPLNVGHHGARDREIIYVEAIISVHDRGTWVADINPLHLTRGANLHLATNCDHCPKGEDQISPPQSLSSVDNWFEYLDLPRNAAIIRARGNWIARLAFASIPPSNHRILIIGSESICWACVREEIPQDSGKTHPDRQLFLC